MSDSLSLTMRDALAHCAAAGGLKYVRGGFWIEATQDAAAFLSLSKSQRLFASTGTLPWHTTTHTIKALLKRGVVFEPEEARGEYPTLVKAVEKTT